MRRGCRVCQMSARPLALAFIKLIWDNYEPSQIIELAKISDGAMLPPDRPAR